MTMAQDKLDDVFDFTMLYVDHQAGERPSERTFLRGRFPRAIYCYIQRFSMEKVKQVDPHVWLNQRFEEKEELLKNFYTKKQLPDKAHEIWTRRRPGYWHCLLFWSTLSIMFCGLIWSSRVFRLYLVAVVWLYRFYFTDARRLDRWIHQHVSPSQGSQSDAQ